MENKWLKEALFNGFSSNAFKLGTVLAFGWFWTRTEGCSVLYRGQSLESVDFDNILAVEQINAEIISPPDYVAHTAGSAYFYLVQRINGSGYQEQTLSASVKVALDENGDIFQPMPNAVLGLMAEPTQALKVRFNWWYSSLSQFSTPAYFKIYYDAGTSQIDYQNPVATIEYNSGIFYEYTTDSFDQGRYLFAVRVEDLNGSAGPDERVSVELKQTVPEAVEILHTETV
ncbi:MAG: hypothetical protein ACYSSI_01950 [Planctomycetota bacterium]|jgi:hypothetical protein